TLNWLGSMKLYRLAKRKPDAPPRAAPIANAHSLNLNAGTPMTAAASSSSRIASHDRPTRLLSSLRTAKTMIRQTVSASQYHGFRSETVKITLSGEGGPSAPGMAEIPCGPRVMV